MIERSFYFLRHGETDWNVQKRLQGHTDTPLNENGREQARAAIALLQNHPIDRIVASPLSRAFETAEIVNAALKKPIETHEGLKERHFGLFEGKTHEEIEIFAQENMHLIPARRNPSAPLDAPGAENYDTFRSRVVACVAELLTRHDGQNLLIVAHGGVYRTLCRHFWGETDQAKNAWPYHFHRENDNLWVLKELS